MNEFIIFENRFLGKRTTGYYNCDYLRFKQPGNPDFLNWLKNTFNDENICKLNTGRELVEKTLCVDIPKILLKEGIQSCALVCVPRAKMVSKYNPNQMMFVKAVSRSADQLNLVDGAYYIKRCTDTKTTHLKNAKDLTWVNSDGLKEPNNGMEPYPGITNDTCIIEKNLIKGKNIILVDDIYTQNVNIDEDCIQALYDAGAKKVVFYAIAKTR